MSAQPAMAQLADPDAKLEIMMSIATDAVELLETSKTYAEWLGALGGAMGAYLGLEPVLEGVRISEAKRLASLAKYLAEDMLSVFEGQGDELARQLGLVVSNAKEKPPTG